MYSMYYNSLSCCMLAYLFGTEEVIFFGAVALLLPLGTDGNILSTDVE